MGKYIHYFATEAEFNEAIANNYSIPWVSYTEGVSVDFNQPLFVDLGLPSGILWATMNVGAKGLYDRGDTYKWGGITPQSNLNDDYRFGTAAPYTKYNPTDGQRFLDFEDDIANIEWGDRRPTMWHAVEMPSSEDCQELLVNTTQMADRDKNITIFTSNVNGESIIFPGSDARVGFVANPYFCIWTKEINTAYSTYGIAYAFGTYDDSGSYYLDIRSSVGRASCLNVRPVAKLMEK